MSDETHNPNPDEDVQDGALKPGLNEDALTDDHAPLQEGQKAIPDSVFDSALPDGADGAAQNTAAPPPGEEEPKKRNLRNKKILSNLNAEAAPFDDMDFDASQHSKKRGGKKTKKRKPKHSKFKTYRTWLIWIVIFCIGGYGYHVMTQPRIGTIAYGLCKVFLERRVQFPDNLRISTVKGFKDSIRIWYVRTDAFGEYLMEPIQCHFEADEQYAFRFEKVTINRRDVPQEEVDAFNTTLPVIRFTEDYLIIPPPLPDSLQDVQIEVFTGF